MLTNWKARALKAEAAIAEGQTRLDAVDALMRDRACLVSIVADGPARVNRFTFIRNGSLTVIESYSAVEDDVPGWKSALLSPQGEKS